MKANLPTRLSSNCHQKPIQEDFTSIDNLPLKKSCTSETLNPDMQSKRDPSTQQKFCRTHPDIKGQYFLTQQPWIRLCKQCALNKALCGHQIQKQYSQVQFEKKITLTSLIQQIQNTIKNTEQQGKYLGTMADCIDKNYTQNIACHMKTIDTLLKQLTTIRQLLYSTYQTNVSKKINQLYQRQGHLNNCGVNLKKHLENIQNNYCDLISNNYDNNEQFNRHIEIIKGQIERARQVMYMEYEKKQLQNIPDKIIDTFSQKIIQIKNKRKILDDITIPNKNNQEIQEIVESKKQSNIISERQSFPTRIQEAKFYSGRDKYKKSIINNDQNLTNRRQANLSLRSNSKKQSICSITKVHTSSKKGFGLKQSHTSIFNGMGNGEQFFS